MSGAGKTYRTKDAKNPPIPRRDDDGAWKFLIGKFFYDMLRRCLPLLYENADIGKLPVFLDKELNEIRGRVKGKKRTVDLLVSVPMKNGTDEWVWLHLEIQGRGGGDLSSRMFQYMALIHARYGKPLVALAIITSKRSKTEPEFYKSSLFGTEVTYTYNRLVVEDFDPVILEESDNPFDLALLASQKAMLSERDEAVKFAYLKELIRLLGDRGWDHEAKHDLLFFMEAIINLTDETLMEEIQIYEESLQKEAKIMFVTYAEQVGRKKGREEGHKEGRKKGREEGLALGINRGRDEKQREIARSMLADNRSAEEISKYTGLSIEEIESL
jgi:predicted transposase/invertase (TIGR01784 family)